MTNIALKTFSLAVVLGVLAGTAPMMAQPPRPTAVTLAAVPASSTIIFHTNQMIYTMNSAGGNITKITFQQGRAWDHVSLSPDRSKVVANYWENGHSKLMLFDLAAGTEVALLPDFYNAGLGGVDWDLSGNIYFAGVEDLPYPENTVVMNELIANAAANDVYRVRYDGTDVRRLTWTPDRGEADVSVSADGNHIAYRTTFINPADHDYSEIWVDSTTGDLPRLVYQSTDAVRTVHDPTLSPDGTEVVFSMVNPNAHNFPATVNTAHDLWRVRLDGSELTRITAPGPISIIPDWVGTKIVYLLLQDNPEPTPDFFGAVIMNADGSNAVRINGDSNIPKFIR
jgi:Tol biopolymer transport system component